MIIDQDIKNALKAQRYRELIEHPNTIGINYLKANFKNETLAPNWQPTLDVYFVSKNDTDQLTGILSKLTANHFAILDAKTNQLINLKIDGPPLYPDEDNEPERLTLKLPKNSLTLLKEDNDYILELVNITTLVVGTSQIYSDPFFKQAIFSVDLSTDDFDCLSVEQIEVPEPVEAKPDIDYLAKDYESFRTLMLHRLSALMPDSLDEHPASIEVAVIEALAYAADQLSYYQDAVATEAYLSTAKQRISVKRHARLLDYPVHEGCNARTWAHIDVADEIILPAGTQLLSKTENYSEARKFTAGSEELAQIMRESPFVFETLYPITLFPEHNNMPFYTWGSPQFTLPAGTTSTTLLGAFPDLKAGDVLILEEVLNADTAEATANSKQRHAVRLTNVVLSKDPIGGRFLSTPSDTPVDVTDIEWHPEDALPFELVIAKVINNQSFSAISVARGNIVLADHGQSITENALDLTAASQSQHKPVFKNRDLIFRTPFEVESSLVKPASGMLLQDPKQAYPVDMTLQQNEEIWENKPDLLDSEHTATHFVTEIDNDRHIYIRFGDGLFGKQPQFDSLFEAQYRIGNGLLGNISADSLVHIVSQDSAILGIRNPLPAQGGIAPESISQVKLYAPQAFKKQQRCVTQDDYKQRIETHPEVRQAAVILKWTGSWPTFFIAVLRQGYQMVDEAFKALLIDFLQPYQLIGHAIEIIAPHYVPVDISLHIYTKKGYAATAVQQQLKDYFSNRILANQQRGFFHPDNFSFGQSIYLSKIINAALNVPGVSWIDIVSSHTWFKKLHATQAEATTSLENGVISVGALEVVQVSNTDLGTGQINFYMTEE